MYICVLGESILPLCLRFVCWSFELFRQCGFELFRQRGFELFRQCGFELFRQRGFELFRQRGFVLIFIFILNTNRQ